MRRAVVLSVLLALGACGSGPEGGDPQPAGATAGDAATPEDVANLAGLSRTARPEIVEGFAQDRLAPRHASDGGGRAWLEEGGDVVAGSFGRWTFLFEAGPLGVAEGGAVVFQAPPFWHWSPVQDRRSDQPGYTRVETEAEGVMLDSLAFSSPPPGMLVVRIGGRALEPGERLRFSYGAGQAGARADSYADRDSAFWFAVDGDGDGVRSLVSNPPTIDVLPGNAAKLSLVLPSTARPGDRVRLVAAVLDRTSSAGVRWEGDITLRSDREGLTLPGRMHLEATNEGSRTVEFRAVSPGTYRVHGRLTGARGEEIAAISNPLVVGAEVPPVLWGDLHGHSGLSDGTGRPEDFFRYARDVAGLDIVALTDHDHWGVRPLDDHPDQWAAISAQVEHYHEPGRFVTLPAFEWTSWLHGHRHVLWFEAGGHVLSSLDPRYETPQGLWDALAGQEAVTVAHHSAGGPIATNWAYRPDPRMEPVTEVVSIHGSSEALDSPGLIYSPVEGNFVRDVLDSGLRFGFIGSGDGHDGHPGLSRLASPNGIGGLAAFLTEDLSREGVLAALRSRRTYATSGSRIVLRADLDGVPMGAVVSAGGPRRLIVKVSGTASVANIEVVRGGVEPGRVVDRSAHTAADVSTRFTLPLLRAGEYVYVRVTQSDGGLAWSSPHFVEE